MKYWTFVAVIFLSRLCVERRVFAKPSRRLLKNSHKKTFHGPAGAHKDKKIKQLYSTHNPATIKIHEVITGLNRRKGAKSHIRTINKNGRTNSFQEGGRKSTIDIHENLARTPVLYSSPDGKDYYVFVHAKPSQQQQGITSQTSGTLPLVPNHSSKTFLVTISGKQPDEVEEKIRNALSSPREMTSRTCSCPCCPCACSTPKLLNEFSCSCAKPTFCPCGAKQKERGSTLTIFPMAGQSLRQSACICPCCLCSCSEPGYESYGCGCQKSPPDPCPCGANAYDQTFSESNALQYPPSNCPCWQSSSTSCSCPSNSLPAPGTSNPVSSGNQVVSWTETMPPGQSCSCPCCQCACAKAAYYPNYQCGCASEPATPCPCANDAVPFSHAAVDSNVVRSSENAVYPTSSVSTPSSGPISQTYHAGGYEIQDECDCFCCPCSCSQTMSVESDTCICGPEQQAACACQSAS